MAPNRIKAAFEAWKLERSARQAVVCEEHSLAQAGARASDALRPYLDSDRLARELRLLCAQLGDLDARIALLDAALEHSLVNDREDYARVTDLMRWMVIGRGLCERVVLRDAKKRALREQAPVQATLGRIAVDGPEAGLRDTVPATILREINSARSRALEARSKRDELLHAYGGKPWPNWIQTVVDEVTAFARTLWRVAAQKVVQRPPAIAGFIAGWWLAHAFTDSWIEGALHDLGLGGHSYLAPETRERLAFWLPLVAAALCTYVGSRIDARIRRRYAPELEPSAPEMVTAGATAEQPPQM